VKEIEKQYLQPSMMVPKKGGLTLQIVTFSKRVQDAAPMFMGHVQRQGWMPLKAKFVVFKAFGFWPRANVHYPAKRQSFRDKYRMRKYLYRVKPAYDGWKREYGPWFDRN
jgi:hypothetical protein